MVCWLVSCRTHTIRKLRVFSSRMSTRLENTKRKMASDFRDQDFDCLLWMRFMALALQYMHLFLLSSRDYMDKYARPFRYVGTDSMAAAAAPHDTSQFFSSSSSAPLGMACSDGKSNCESGDEPVNAVLP